MAKTISIPYCEKTYTLEFTRNSVKALEERGFVISDIGDKPMSTLPALFAGAFKAHHPWVKQEVVDNIFDKITNREQLFRKLAEMYNETIETLMAEPEEDEGNVTWDANW